MDAMEKFRDFMFEWNKNCCEYDENEWTDVRDGEGSLSDGKKIHT